MFSHTRAVVRVDHYKKILIFKTSQMLNKMDRCHDIIKKYILLVWRVGLPGRPRQDVSEWMGQLGKGLCWSQPPSNKHEYCFLGYFHIIHMCLK